MTKLPWLILLPFLALATPGRGQDAKKSAAKSPSPSPSPPIVKEADEESIEEGPAAKAVPKVAVVSTIKPEELANFANYAPQIQQLIRNALDLTKLNLTYTFGGSNPSEGGMDCSGTIVHLLQGLGMKGVPRQSDQICGWVQDRTLLHRITAADSLTHPEFYALQPGNLIFWSGTYVTAPRKIPVTHVMIYLGKLKKTGKHVVFGASDGRVYLGQRRTGVSVFDFTLPKAGGNSTLYGYGLIPGIGKVEVKPLDSVTVAMATVDKLLPPPAKEPLTAKDGVAPLKTTAAVPVEIRRATPAIAPTTPPAPAEKPAEVAAAKPKPPTPKATSPVSKSPTPKPTVKPKSAAPKPKVTTQRRAPPPPPTAKQKFEAAANKVAGSIKNALAK